jgi:hypothetical protein
MLQRAAAHRPPALPDQLGLWALHAFSGMRGAGLGPSGRGRSYRTCGAISSAPRAETRAPQHPLRPKCLGGARQQLLLWPEPRGCVRPALDGGAPAAPAPLALPGTPLGLLRPAPGSSKSRPL